jgi:CRP-like cAMP-binding protein
MEAIHPSPELGTAVVDPAFPVLSAAQIARVAVHGRTRRVVRGEVLSLPGVQHIPCFVVISGQLEIVRLSARRPWSPRTTPGSSRAK